MISALPTKLGEDQNSLFFYISKLLRKLFERTYNKPGDVDVLVAHWSKRS